MNTIESKQEYIKDIHKDNSISNIDNCISESNDIHLFNFSKLDADIRYDFKVAIFDLDMTLWDEKELFPYTHSILSELKSKNITIYMSSFNAKAEHYCKILNIEQYFSKIYFGLERDKVCIINEIKSKHPELCNNDFVFFDDNINNIHRVKKHTNIQSVLITNGISWECIPIKNNSYRFIGYTDDELENND